ncbi:ATP-binding domain-containing protein [Uliginosibacterium sp. 31-16]|uniref:DEAD/DEAH box helicase n=1 Tax=Uliginosibacterium sp. 31-16 TaxID=3068315 RepID=UPI00273D72CF|nr:ATP-binding domain-containing protein [Uliginosibacterium sp. 31-16]MDP5239651.1 ATP-binding domain-containing protein [Uliginosibacterium sp. 31-16]
MVDFLQENQQDLGLDQGVLFFSFPLFREEENLLVADLVVVSPFHGVCLISFSSSPDAVGRLEGAFSQIFSRLVRYPRLRSGRASLKFDLDAKLWAQEGEGSDDLLVGVREIADYFNSKRRGDALPSDAYDELISVLDGSKALVKPKERNLAGFEAQSRISIISRLEEEIRRFDRDQRVAYMTEVYGPQRIRGLAGSGKTVVLALKAAMTAIRNPDAKIAVTFYTKSLYQHIKQLITRFYRMHEDRDPDWQRIRVLHGWGGATTDGLYYSAARQFGVPALSLSQAQAGDMKQPFAFACRQLLESPCSRSSIFDYVFVDEAQDFPPEFMRLALLLAREEQLVIAYDVFQTIFDVETPTASSLFGTDARGEPSISFEEDIILHKCYRNPREILVCAHAVGFGVYGKRMSQILESKEHWEDFGYQVVDGELNPGEAVCITRPQENSPSTISSSNNIDQIVQVRSFRSATEEVGFVVDKICADIGVEGVSAEDILVICADDRNSNGYFSLVTRGLLERGIGVNNLQSASFGLTDFQIDKRVTLSTIYKAKGNEAYVVYIIGIDALFLSPSPKSRNKAFTAMTRAKGWLCVTGLGMAAEEFAKEIDLAKINYPNLRFNYPTQPEIDCMKRDLIRVDIEGVEDAISRLANDMEPDELEYVLRKKLREIQGRKVKRKTLE